MEKKFYTDNFENFLKESTDDFRMYPSKKVWHSIYNDLHPSRKWPSLAVCLLLISSILYVSLSHQNDLSIPVKNNFTRSTSPATGVISGNTAPKTKLPVSSPRSQTADTRNREMLTNVDALSPNNLQGLYAVGNEENDLAKTGVAVPETDQDVATNFSAPGFNVRSSTQAVVSPGELTTDAETASKDQLTEELKTNKKVVAAPDKVDEKAWIEDFAFHNKPFASIWKSKVSYQFYVTPSIGFRKLSRNTDFDPLVAQSFVAPANASNRQELSHIPAVNMELGANISYSLSKKVNLKFGIQFNYTNYNINAYDLRHPTMTTVMLNDLNSGYPYLVSKPTTLANIDGVYNTKLDNNTYQVSLPIGADIKLAGKNNLKWFAGASIQPTYIAGGQAYLLSSDLKNYVDGNSMMRNWNLNAGIETFLSYKTKSGIVLNAGPQFRYQVLSTLTQEYTYDERLYNLGLKIGIVTKF